MMDMSHKHSHDHDDHQHHNHIKKYVDPVCGMSTDDETAFIPYEHEGKTYYFCSGHCLTKFKNDPDSFTHSDHDIKPQEDKPPEGGVTYTHAEYTCPMHPEIVQDSPGSCPKCGMALEPRTITLSEDEQNPEYDYMRKRFIFGAILTVPLVLIAMREMLPGGRFIENLAPVRTLNWLELILATPVVLWAGWPFFVRGVNKSLNMFTLISLGVSVAYIYSLIAVLFPQIFQSPCGGRTAL